MMSVQVDQIKQSRITWNNKYLNPNSNEYITLEDEAVYAVSNTNISIYLVLDLLHVQFYANVFIIPDWYCHGNDVV